MKTELTEQEINNNLIFLERCTVQGKEAEAIVQLKYKLIQMGKEKTTENNPPDDEK